MSEIQTMENGRAKLSLDFDDDLETETKEEVDRKIREISEESGFISTSPKPKKVSQPKKKINKKIKVDRRRRTKTGRTYPFNTKIKPETYDSICRLADNATEEEGRPVSLAEIIERSITALENKAM